MSTYSASRTRHLAFSVKGFQNHHKARPFSHPGHYSPWRMAECPDCPVIINLTPLPSRARPHHFPDATVLAQARGSTLSSPPSAGFDGVPFRPGRIHFILRPDSLLASRHTSLHSDRDMIFAGFTGWVTSSRCAICCVAEWKVATTGLASTRYLRLPAARHT